MERACFAITFVMVVLGARPALAQHRFAPEHLPGREVGLNVSGWWLMDSEHAISGTGLYTRKLASMLAIEGGVDVGSAASRPFASTFLQFRVMNGGAERPGEFFTLGLARAFADRDHPNAPRGNGWVMGLGIRPPVNIANRMAIRLEGQLGKYRDERVALRLMLGFAASFD